MNICTDRFLNGEPEYIYWPNYSTKFDRALVDFFKRELLYKKKYSYGFGGFLEKGHEHSGDPNLPDMIESYTFTTGRNEPVPHELCIIQEQLFIPLTQLGAILINKLLCADHLKCSKLNISSFEFTMQANHFYEYEAQYVEKTRKFRMGSHVDYGLFTIMPHGPRDDLQVLINDEWQTPPKKSESIFLFPGMLSDFLSNGKIAALKHRVAMSSNHNRRLSFAFTAIPKAEARLLPQGNIEREVSGHQYMVSYLANHVTNNLDY